VHFFAIEVQAAGPVRLRGTLASVQPNRVKAGTEEPRRTAHGSEGQTYRLRAGVTGTGSHPKHGNGQSDYVLIEQRALESGANGIVAFRSAFAPG